ncbi:MAG TPA: nucleotidyltransferase domain-containing protein [Ktedonobacteraceae bacterium]|jgi:predicted nucleotidyltransferase
MKKSNTIQPIIDKLVEHISAFPSVQKVILYGSRAKGTHNPISDIDIAVAGVKDRREWLCIHRLADVEDNQVPTLLKIDLVQLEHVDPSVQQSIREEGQILYERY